MLLGEPGRRQIAVVTLIFAPLIGLAIGALWGAAVAGFDSLIRSMWSKSA
jgi:hypothetical protein